MSKIIKCPVCGKKKPVRNDANVCSSNCRVKKWRKQKMADKKRLMDFYYSATAEKRIRNMKRERNEKFVECRVDGVLFVEQIAHGKTPMMQDEDLVLIQTGTGENCTYI